MSDERANPIRGVLKDHRDANDRECWQDAARPILNAAGEQIGWQCIGCETPFALPGRCGRDHHKNRLRKKGLYAATGSKPT